MKERLQKILARAGICSRRKAEEYIAQGRVLVDGETVIVPGVKVDPDLQEILFDKRKVVLAEEKIYVLLNKPVGYVTTMHDPQNRPIVTSLLENIKERLFPVGRLDFDTEGALLLTNDGELANQIIHPKFEINKTYLAKIKGRISSQEIGLLENGIEIEGKKTWPATLKVQSGNQSHSVVEICIHEGRKRQVRKMFAAVRHPVIDLKRVAYGGLRLGDLACGKFRILTEKDIRLIFNGKKIFTKEKITYKFS